MRQHDGDQHGEFGAQSALFTRRQRQRQRGGQGVQRGGEAAGIGELADPRAVRRDIQRVGGDARIGRDTPGNIEIGGRPQIGQTGLPRGDRAYRERTGQECTIGAATRFVVDQRDRRRTPAGRRDQRGENDDGRIVEGRGVAIAVGKARQDQHVVCQRSQPVRQRDQFGQRPSAHALGHRIQGVGHAIGQRLLHHRIVDRQRGEGGDGHRRVGRDKGGGVLHGCGSWHHADIPRGLSAATVAGDG